MSGENAATETRPSKSRGTVRLVSRVLSVSLSADKLKRTTSRGDGVGWRGTSVERQNDLDFADKYLNYEPWLLRGCRNLANLAAILVGAPRGMRTPGSLELQSFRFTEKPRRRPARDYDISVRTRTETRAACNNKRKIPYDLRSFLSRLFSRVIVCVTKKNERERKKERERERESAREREKRGKGGSIVQLEAANVGRRRRLAEGRGGEL